MRRLQPVDENSRSSRTFPASAAYYHQIPETAMIKFLLWCILLFLCWPLALVALLLYPLVWLLLVPFRIVGIAVEGVLELVWALVTLPARLLRGPGRA
jgi:hypothetical protein